jgi:hypothetical protein
MLRNSRLSVSCESLGSGDFVRTVGGVPWNEYQRNWRKAHPKYYLYQRRWVKKNRKSVRESQLRHYYSNHERFAIFRKNTRDECYAAYGNKCECCGETRPEFFTIDHINGRKNAKHKAGLTGKSLYQWLASHGYPKDEFRLLCFNCNCARGFRGYCPHERERQQVAAD